VVIDEAYREFVDADRIPDGLNYYRQYENVAVLRTFSKAYGLAALRVGFCVAHEPVAEALRKVQVPFGVSTIAQAAAIASLAAEDELLARCAAIAEQRREMEQGLREAGLSPAESEANFLWLRLGDDTESFAAMCGEEGLSVRPFAGEGVRITVGEPEANARLLQVAAAWQAARS
jgi:histidinol-phosphate aminotransferase